MRKIIIAAVMTLITVSAAAKDIKTVVLTTNPKMHCESCEIRIKKALKFKKGVKAIVTNIKGQTVTVKYDADVINVKDIRKALSEIEYQTDGCDAPKGK